MVPWVGLVVLGGCPPARDDTAGPKKDPIVDPGPDSIKKGTWCCRSCAATATGALSCSGCVAKSPSTTICTGSVETVLADCPGRTTYDGSNVVCY
jgi:hypothetical protein